MNNVQNNPSEPRILEMDDVEDAILARWEDPDENQASEDEEDAPLVTEEETDGELEFEEVDEDETDEEETEEDQAEDQTDDDEEEVVELSDDFEIEITVDGETQSAPLKDLKRLYGQEASLTRKSQEVAAKRKEAEENIGKSQVIFDKLINQAQERYKPYEDIDMMVASKSMTTEDFAQLRKEAQQAKQDLDFLQEEADAYFGELQKQQTEQLQKAAKDCIETLQTAMPDWSNELYNDIRMYAVGQGLPEDQVNQYVDPVVIQILNKARLYDQGKQVATVKKKQAVKKKVLRSQKAPQNEASKRKAQSAKMREKLRSSRDVDDLADVILSRWAD